MQKRFAKIAGEIRLLACGLGACIATDLITVDGMPVRFMYREKPDNDLDSGWRFFAGSETDEYVENPENSGIYDVNTVANHDPDIIPHLEAPEGSAFERVDGGQPFVEVFDFQIVTSAATAYGRSLERHAGGSSTRGRPEMIPARLG